MEGGLSYRLWHRGEVLLGRPSKELVASVASLSKPDMNKIGAAVYVAHQADLLRPLISILLINADGISPKREDLCGMTENAQEFPEAVINL